MFKKILTIISIAVVVIGVGFGYFLLYQEKEIEAKQRKEVEINLKIASKENSLLKEKFEKIEIEFKKASIELDMQAAQNQRLTKTVDELNSFISGVETELSLLSQERDVLIARLENKDNVVKDLQGKIAILEKERNKLSTRTTKEVELGDITVKEGDLMPKAQGEGVVKQKKQVSLLAEIMAFNKDYKFIVLNRGQRDGLELKGVYALIISGNKVGRVKSDRIYDSMSVFDILEGDAKLVEGMEVELLLEE